MNNYNLQPNFFIVGAAKAGTTSLYHYLFQHPDIFLPNVKEIQYYADVEARTASAYRKPRPGKFYHYKVIKDREVYLDLFSSAGAYKILTDVSPSYLWDKKSAGRIYSDNPNAKILIVLRNPVLRAHSHFLMDIRNGAQDELDFVKAVERDNKVIPYIWGKAHLYSGLGMYFEQIKRYLDLFGPKQVKIVVYEEFFKDPKVNLLNLLTFLEVDTSIIDQMDFDESHNTFALPKNRFYRKLLQLKRRSKISGEILPSKLKQSLKKRVLSNSQKPKLLKEEYGLLFKYFEEDLKKTEDLLQEVYEMKVDFNQYFKV